VQVLKRLRIPLVLVAAIAAGLFAWREIRLRDTSVAQAPAGRYTGYRWPVAPGCTQIAENLPDFANLSRRRPDGTVRAHLGIDIVPPADDARLFAAKAGVVTASSRARGNGWGHHVILRHDDGLSTVYAHLVTPSDLRSGERVPQGGLIGIAGQTETYFVHLHFEVHLPRATSDWTQGRLDPVSVVGALEGCRNSAAPPR
jgi:murein DD-endopeptidase MepM/ murein hydrolase activator NlpD